MNMNMNKDVNQDQLFTKDGMPTYYHWFQCKYLGQLNIFGDVAFDNNYDKNWPQDNKYSSIKRHLKAYDGRMKEMFEESWREYKQFVRTWKKVQADIKSRKLLL